MTCFHPRYGIGIGEVNRICGMMEAKKLLPGSSDLFTEVSKPSLLRRLDDLNQSWAQAEHQEKLLRIVVAAASETQSDLRTMTNQFLMQVGAYANILFVFGRHLTLAIPTAS